MVLECRSPPTGTNRQLKGPEGQGRKKWEVSRGGERRKKKISLSSEVKLAEKFPFSPQILCLLDNSTHFRHSSDFFFSSKSQRKLTREEEVV